MPAVLLSQHAARHIPVDWELIWVIIAVVGIVVLEIFFVLGGLRLHHVRSTGAWRRLRERGAVIVDGPVLIWAHDLPPRPTFSTFNLRQYLEASNERVTREATAPLRPDHFSASNPDSTSLSNRELRTIVPSPSSLKMPA